MPNTIDSISHIQIGEDSHKIDAVSISGYTLADIQRDFQLKSNITTVLDDNSTDMEYPSAKAIYDIIGDLNQRADPTIIQSKNYLTFDIVEGGTLGLKKSSSSATEKTISYRVNDGSWNEMTLTLMMS